MDHEISLWIGRIAEANEAVRRLLTHNTDHRLTGSKHHQVTALVTRRFLNGGYAAIGLKGFCINHLYSLPSSIDFSPKRVKFT
jgi:hypothetical protein